MSEWLAGKRVLVIVPTYNEAENLEALAGAVFEVATRLPCALEILIVDDASPDGTGAIADRLAARDARVHVLHRPGKEGLGRAYLAGFDWALARNYDLVVQMDADFSHDPAHLPALLSAAQKADVVLGSRYVPGGGTVNWGLGRRLLSRGGSAYARAILRLPYRDLTGGYKVFRRAALEALSLSTVRSEGYAFQIELTLRAHRRGLRIRELPIVFEDRRVGQSKMSRRIVLEAVFLVWKLRGTQ
ncbi:MAG: polyprenol monophosphomannose synthase [Deltaproteobacteria bacterium]|nr:MAG: polyprenol monophosphomannose synthase [Deltaproteobacteria bacterium]